MKKNEVPAIPMVAYEHIRIEVNKVARRFRLDEMDTADLHDHIVERVYLALVNNYDHRRSQVYTFVQRVTHNQLLKWMDKETRVRNLFCCSAEENARRQAHRLLRSQIDQNDSIDDTSEDVDNIISAGDDVPTSELGEERAWDPVGYHRLAKMRLVRLVVSNLQGLSKLICETYLEEESLRKVQKRLRIPVNRFFSKYWPRARRDFIDEWREQIKHFCGDR